MICLVLKMLLTKFSFSKVNMSGIGRNILSQRGKCHGKEKAGDKRDGTLLSEGFSQMLPGHEPN